MDEDIYTKSDEQIHHDLAELMAGSVITLSTTARSLSALYTVFDHPSDE